MNNIYAYYNNNYGHGFGTCDYISYFSFVNISLNFKSNFQLNFFQKELYERQREEDKQELKQALEKSLDEARQTQQVKINNNQSITFQLF